MARILAPASVEVRWPKADAGHLSREAQIPCDLVSVVIGLEWTVLLDTQIRSLGLGQLGHFHAEFLKVQTGYFFVQVLGQGVDSLLVLAGIAFGP